MSLSDWELGVASGLNEMKEKLSLCEVRQEEHVLYLMEKRRVPIQGLS